MLLQQSCASYPHFVTIDLHSAQQPLVFTGAVGNCAVEILRQDIYTREEDDNSEKYVLNRDIRGNNKFNSNYCKLKLQEDQDKRRQTDRRTYEHCNL